MGEKQKFEKKLLDMFKEIKNKEGKIKVIMVEVNGREMPLMVW